LNFDAAFAFVLAHPVIAHADNGEHAFRGIAQGQFNAYRASKSEGIQDVRLISESELRDFYLTRHWNASACEKYPGNLGLAVFDCAASNGAGTSIRFLQRALWITPEDGIAGVDTVRAAKDAPWERTAWGHLVLRRAFLRSLPDAKVSAASFARLNLLRDAVFG
jgi:lysozyme family protein